MKPVITQVSLFRVETVHDFCVPKEAQVDQEIITINRKKFGIDDARELIDRANRRPQQTQTQCIVVKTEFVTHEAQNALLKLLEEPPLTTTLFFVVPRDTILLPTVASRFQEVHPDCEKRPAYSVFSEFLLADYKDRLVLIEQVIKKKDHAWQQELKNGLRNYLTTTQDLSILREASFVLEHILTRGASNKLLLEHLALVLPVRLSDK
jgi:DNA polymerase III delta prime subunit